MAVSMKGKDIISIHDLTREEVAQILKTSEIIKLMAKAGQMNRPLEGKTLAMIFSKPSTRTRISFEVAIWELGGHGLYLGAQDLQLKRGETIADTARVLSRYVHGIMIRTFDHSDVVTLAEYATVPVVNGLTDLLHPCQILADLFTIQEKKGRLDGLKLAYVGDGNNVAHSLMFGCPKAGLDIAVATPEGYEPVDEIVRLARQDAASAGTRLELTHDPFEAVRDADVIYTDVWASMGQEDQHTSRLRLFKPFQVNAELVRAAKPDAIFMHCLPAHRGEEVTDEVVDAPYSVVFDEAENRLHVQKAILALVM